MFQRISYFYHLQNKKRKKQVNLEIFDFLHKVHEKPNVSQFFSGHKRFFMFMNLYSIVVFLSNVLMLSSSRQKLFLAVDSLTDFFDSTLNNSKKFNPRILLFLSQNLCRSHHKVNTWIPITFRLLSSTNKIHFVVIQL